MGVTSLPPVLKLLAHDLRWHLLTLLMRGDWRVQELVTATSEPMNLVSYHLKKLRDAGIVSTRRSEADARDVYYRLDLERLRTLYLEAGGALHPALSGSATRSAEVAVQVLFVCTHNSARSQMAEGLLRHAVEENVTVYSAGNAPIGVHPDAIHTMDALGIDIRDQHAKPLDTFTGQRFDYVITVCDRAREACPMFPGGQQLHWGFPDPVTIADDIARRAAFAEIAQQLQTRIAYFLPTLTKAA